ncbi:hypothetical protein GCM10010191_58600 [Actinomadura vinacea]|uniref:Immunity protein Imm1 n=1 Tax=Actinomadura vinacea TaxID=115336 RepID=A0ABP5WTL6_9ACTN
MNLTVYLGMQTFHPVTWPQAKRIITDLVEQPTHLRSAESSEDSVPASVLKVFAELPKPDWPHGGQTAEFTLSAPSHEPIAFLPRFDSYLHVAVNPETGYGALKWMVTEDSTVFIDSHIADQVWLSDSPRPPITDPNVFADPGYPRYHHPRSTLPINRIRAAVEEFCRAATGHRPTCIDWTPGKLDGERLDTPRPRDESVDRCLDPWCEQDCGPSHHC